VQTSSLDCEQLDARVWTHAAFWSACHKQTRIAKLSTLTSKKKEARKREPFIP
jgi:hypothetical protein